MVALGNPFTVTINERSNPLDLWRLWHSSDLLPSLKGEICAFEVGPGAKSSNRQVSSIQQKSGHTHIYKLPLREPALFLFMPFFHLVNVIGRFEEAGSD